MSWMPSFDTDHPTYLKKCRICGQEFVRATPENALTALSGHLAEQHHGESAGLVEADKFDARWISMLTFDDCDWLRKMQISPF